MVGLTVHRSNRLEALLEILAADLRAAPPDDPVAAVEIVVGNRGMERWLRQQLAQRLGVCANVHFAFPAGALDGALATLLDEPAPDPGDRDPAPASPWSPEVLTWAILEELPGLLGADELAPVRDYLAREPGPAAATPSPPSIPPRPGRGAASTAPRPVQLALDLFAAGPAVEPGAPEGDAPARTPVGPRRYALARQIADVFDRYATYRPRLAVAWSQGAPTPPDLTVPAGLRWQARLWRAVAARLGEDGAHGAARILAAAQRLRRGARPAGPVAPLRIFGVSSLPPSYLTLLGLVARVTRVDLFLLCPSHLYWADLQARRGALGAWRHLATAEVAERLRAEGLDSDQGPPLLASFGRLARDFQIVLESQPEGYEDRFDTFVDVDAVGGVGDGVGDVDGVGGGVGVGNIAGVENVDGVGGVGVGGAVGGVSVGDVVSGGFAGIGDGVGIGDDVGVDRIDRNSRNDRTRVASALARLQADILHLRPPAAPGVPRTLAPGDDSLQLHACHGPTRQVEILRDLLLGLLDDHPHLEPRDVVVMTPDIETYAPLISAVFSDGAPARRPDEGWGPAGAPRLPFEIADLSVRRENPVAEALLQALEMTSGRIDAPAVVDLLTLEPVRERFGIDAIDLPQIGAWVRESAARWGLDEDHRAAHGQPRDRAYTWRFALDRLLLGVTMPDEGQPFAGVVPVDSVEGQVADLLGRFVDFVTTFGDEVTDLAAPRTLAEWVPRLEQTLDRLTAPPPEAAWMTRRVRDTLGELGRAGERARATQSLTVEALRDALAGRFDLPGAGRPANQSAVTFCALVPMRSIPYKVVCLLGLDDGAFPRSAPNLAFDLTHREPRLGDRNARDEDRYLFLEALLAAREHLIILYTGRDLRTNEPLAPAVPVSELCDVLDATFDAESDGRTASARLTTTHPLQPFSPRSFEPRHPAPGDPGARRPWSFDRRLLAGALAARDGVRAVPRLHAEDPAASAPARAPARATGRAREVIELDDLVRCLRSPIRYLFKRALRLHLDEREDDLPGREPIALDPLEAWRVQDKVLRAVLAGEPRAGVRARLEGDGLLPLGYPGEVTLDGAWTLAEAMREEAARRLELPEGAPWPAPAPPAPIELEVGGVLVRGQLTGIVGGDLVSLIVGGESAGRLLRPWVHLLAWGATGQAPPHGSAVLVFGKPVRRGEAEAFTVQLLPPASLEPGWARPRLEELVAIYRSGVREPTPLFARASYDLVKAWQRNASRDDAKRASEAAKAAFKGFGPATYGDGPTDIDDPHIRAVYPDGYPFHAGPDGLEPRHKALALTVYEPLHTARRTASQVLAPSARGRQGP